LTFELKSDNGAFRFERLIGAVDSWIDYQHCQQFLISGSCDHYAVHTEQL
jgi:hypothetical protein